MREYLGLSVLENAGAPLAPKSWLVDETSFPLPVIVQSWVSGAVKTRAPRSERKWQAVCGYYRDLHAIRKEYSPPELPAAVLCPCSAAEANAITEEHLGLIPQEKQPVELVELVDRLRAKPFPEWEPPAIVLLRNDPTPRNFIQQGRRLYSVDWENCGWGDPAFEMADWFAHPAYLNMSPHLKTALLEFHGGPHRDPEFLTRFNAYSQFSLVWWVIRLSRYLVSEPDDEMHRVENRPRGWRRSLQVLYRSYLQHAQMCV